MAGFSENMEALKHNFLLRGFFNKRGYFNLTDLSPVAYRQGALTAGGERAPVRVWLSAAVLFTKSSDGSNAESLTSDGKSRLDSAIASYLDYLPGGVLTVEGYAQAGTRDEQFVRARARAAAAREHLIGRFSLDPQMTGLISLGADAADSPNDGTWDGIALAVYLEKRTVQ